MADLLISRKYAKALLEVSIERNNLEATYDELSELKQVFAEAQIDNFLAKSPKAVAAKQNIVDLLLQNASEQVANFIKVIAQNGRLNELSAITEIFLDQVNDYLARGEVKVTSVQAISEAQKQKMIDVAKRKFNLNEVKLENQVDENLIGGFVLKNKNKVIDASVKKQLAKIAAEL